MDQAKDFIGKKVTVKMDRPMGSRHPNWGFYLSHQLWLHS